MGRKHWQEFETTGVEQVRRLVERSVYDPEKQKEAQEFLYAHDTKYPRRALIVSILALVISFAALGISAYAAFWKVAPLPPQSAK